LKDAELSALRLEKIGFVFQSFNLLSTLSAFENVELPMSLLGKRNKAQRRSAALSLLRLVGLESRSSHLPSELSGGEQQRVAIARALANEPDLLLLDEPTGDLDTAATVMIMDLLLKINTGPRKMTAVMVTHNPDLECYADRVLYVAGGTIAGVAVNEQQSQLDADNYKKFLERDGGEGDIDD
jgi:putative ABC transport system ATP-binding protein